MREDMMSKMLRNTICIKSEEDRKDEEERRKQQTEASRREERIQGVAEEDLTLPLRSTVLQEYVSVLVSFMPMADKVPYSWFKRFLIKRIFALYLSR